MKYIIKNCGCCLSKSELTELNQFGYRCPKHPDNGIEYITKECVDCGKTMILSPKQGTTLRCQGCVKTRQSNRAKKRYKEAREALMETQNKIDLSLYTQGLDRYLPD